MSQSKAKQQTASSGKLNCPAHKYNKNGTKVRPVVQQQQPEPVYYAEEGGDEVSYGADSQAEYSAQDDMNGDFGEGQLGAPYNQQQETQATRPKMTAEMKRLEANVEWDTVELHFDHVMNLATDYVTEGNKGSLKLKDNGLVTLSLANELLEMGLRTNAPDFPVLTKEEIAKASNTKKKAPLPTASDIVKSVYLENFAIEGWDERVLLHVKSIPKFQKEGHFGNTDNVNQMIYPGSWKDPNNSIKIVDRQITNAMIDFQRRYPGVSPKNLDDGIQKAKDDHYLVNLESPMVNMINQEGAAHIKGGQYKKPDLVVTNQVLIPKSIVKEYRAKTIDSMSEGISYATITSGGGFEIAFEAPVPSHMQANHNEYIKSKGQTGRQFLAFADTPYKSNGHNLNGVLNENVKNKSMLFKDATSQTLRFKGKLVVAYKTMNEEVLEDL